MIPIKDVSKLKKNQIVYVFGGDCKWVGCKIIKIRKKQYTVLFEEMGGDAPGTRWTEKWFNLLNGEFYKIK